MAYGIYLKLDQTKWFRHNFSSENKLTGTIYTDKQLKTPKNLSGYTVTIKLYKENRVAERFSKDATIVSATAGTWSYAVNEGEMPVSGVYNAIVQLTKSGVQESTLNHVEFWVIEGPAD